jgi:hypothetical protein
LIFCNVLFAAYILLLNRQPAQPLPFQIFSNINLLYVVAFEVPKMFDIFKAFLARFIKNKTPAQAFTLA